MTIWRELRCDVNGDDCVDSRNAGPMGYDTASALRARGRREGWRRVGDNDVCPRCVKPAANPG